MKEPALECQNVMECKAREPYWYETLWSQLKYRFTPKQESSLLKFSRGELKRVGLFDKDSDYGGMLGESTMKLMECFCKEGHSGYSAQLQVELFTRLASWHPLSELTNDPTEWQEVGTERDCTPLWQSRRSPDCFSKNGGRTYYSVDDKKRKYKKSKAVRETDVTPKETIS